jgi:hypothetical protein
VIINDLNLVGVATLPPKHNSPLVIYANRVVTLSVTSKQLKPVSWWYAQIFEFGSIMYVKQFTSSRPSQLRRKRTGFSGTPVIEKILCQAIPE